MRYSSEHKAQTRVRLLDEAARAIRAQGIDGVSVRSVMDAAGLTHGGFYAHFASKDDLVAHAVEHMFQERYDHLLAGIDTNSPAEALGTLIDTYLSLPHRDAQEAGCPLPSLAPEIARLSEAGRTALARGADRLQAGVETLLTRLGRHEAGEQAVFTIAEMVGAVILARSVTKPDDARRLLETARTQLRRHLSIAEDDGAGFDCSC